MSAQIAGYILGGRICIPYAHAHADVRALLVSGPLSSFFSKVLGGLTIPHAYAHANVRALWVGGHPVLSSFLFVA